MTGTVPPSGLRLRRADLTWQVMDDEVVVLDLAGSAYFRVNASGRILWDRLEAPATRAELVAALVEAYAIDHEQASEDVDAFLAALEDAGLLAT